MLRSVRCFLWLAVLLPVLGSCGDSAIAIASGKVKLNGKSLVRSSSVFSGDVVETASESAAVLQSKGSTAQFGPSTKCVMQENALALSTGSVKVSGAKVVRAGHITVGAVSASGRFLVSYDGRGLVVTALAGSVEIDGGKETIVLTAGKSITTDESGASPPLAKSELRKNLGVAAIVGAGTATGWIIASHLGERDSRDISNTGSVHGR